MEPSPNLAQALSAQIFDDDDEELEEEEGEVIESAPPLQIGEKRVLGALRIKKKLLKLCTGYETPEHGAEATVRYQVELLDGTVVAKSPDEGIVFCVNDDGHLCPALPLAIVTMRHGEKVKLIVQPQYGFGEEGRSSSGNINSVPPNSVLNIDVVLVSYKPVIDVVGDSKVVKKILTAKATSVADDGVTVTVSYVAKLED